MSIGRILSLILVSQIAIGVLLVIGDLQGLKLPSFAPSAPRLSAPVSPGDQRRVFRPDRDRPALNPARDPGQLPDRLVLTHIEAGRYRLEGAISQGDADRLTDQITRANPAIDVLVLQSNGGSVGDALGLGRTIRENGLNIEILHGEFCYSACPYLLAAGTERIIEDGSSIGVHQHYFGESTLLPAAFAIEDIQRGQAEVMSYLSEMGIDPLVMRHAMGTPPDEIYILLQEQLRAYNFITSEQDE